MAAVMTCIDWLENPGGIFHDASATNWSFVFETAWSWFAPVAAIGFLSALILLLFFIRGSTGDAG